MKALTIFLVFAISSINYSVSAQSEKVLVKTLRTENINNISVEMSGEVEAKTWSKDYARVLIHIKHHNAHSNLLKVLITKGRYHIASNIENGTLVLSSKDLETPLIFGNNETILDETISYTIVVPEGIEVRRKNSEQLISIKNK